MTDQEKIELLRKALEDLMAEYCTHSEGNAWCEDDDAAIAKANEVLNQTKD